MTQPRVSEAPSRLARLRGIKLRTLVRDHLGRDPGALLEDFAPGAALVADGAAWVLLDERPARLGPAMAWARRQSASDLHVLADHDTGSLARRAAEFTLPISVWHVEDRVLLPALAEPLRPPPAPAPDHLLLIPMIEAGGATPLVEQGVVSGEVRGLEVCRVVDDVSTGAVRLEVGVGAHDREAFAIIHGDVPTTEALAVVVDAVAEHRSLDAPPHPLKRLAPERLLRWRLEQRPGLIGLAVVVPTEPPAPRPNVKDTVPCSAIGRRTDGSIVVVVCSVGVDLDLIPYATDARLAAVGEPGDDGEATHGGERKAAELVVVAPARDLVPITVELANLTVRPLSLMALRD